MRPQHAWQGDGGQGQGVNLKRVKRGCKEGSQLVAATDMLVANCAANCANACQGRQRHIRDGGVL